MRIMLILCTKIKLTQAFVSGFHKTRKFTAVYEYSTRLYLLRSAINHSDMPIVVNLHLLKRPCVKNPASSSLEINPAVGQFYRISIKNPFKKISRLSVG